MQVSIAMATYNGEKYIQKQLESFLNQSRLPDQIIISDDNSTDNTVSIIKLFIDNAPFDVHLIRNKENLGYCQNFNAAISRTTGDFVFLSDQDDVWYSTKIEEMIDIVRSEPNYLIYMNDALLTDSKLTPTSLTKIGQIKSMGLGEDAFVMGCCCMIRRQLLDFCLPIPIKYPSHDDWLVNIADGLGRKNVSEKVLQYYRRHEENESQFIANRLKKVTEIDIWLTRFKQIFFSKKKRLRQATLYYEQCEAFRDGLIDIEKNVPIAMRESFNAFLELKNKELRLLKLRYKLRRTYFILRLFKGLWYYFFVYDKKSRFKNMLRDMFS